MSTARRAEMYAERRRNPSHRPYSRPFQKRLAAAWTAGYEGRPRKSSGANFDAPLADAYHDGQAAARRWARIMEGVN